MWYWSSRVWSWSILIWEPSYSAVTTSSTVWFCLLVHWFTSFGFTESHCTDYHSFLNAAYAPICEFFLFQSNLFIYLRFNKHLVHKHNLCYHVNNTDSLKPWWILFCIIFIIISWTNGKKFMNSLSIPYVCLLNEYPIVSGVLVHYYHALPFINFSSTTDIGSFCQ